MISFRSEGHCCYLIVGLRALLFAFGKGDWYLISVQSLDGIAAAIFGVLSTLINFDLARGTGRFNFLQGAVASAWYLGAFLSNLAGGYLANRLGLPVRFLVSSRHRGRWFSVLLVLDAGNKGFNKTPAFYRAAHFGAGFESSSENARA